MRFLVAEDSVAIRKGVCMSLIDMGHEVVEADGGYGAIVDIEENDIDVLLTDMQMPGMNGDELIKWVRTNRPSIKTVLMSGHPRVKQFATECGANAYIKKGGLTPWSEKISEVLKNIMS